MIEDFSALFSPPRGSEEEYARTLLEAAGDEPWKVHSTMDGPHGLAFIVYDEFVADKANRLLYPADDPDELLDEEQEAFEESGLGKEDDLPLFKPRGRPKGSKNKKSAASAEDNSNAAEELS